MSTEAAVKLDQIRRTVDENDTMLTHKTRNMARIQEQHIKNKLYMDSSLDSISKQLTALVDDLSQHTKYDTSVIDEEDDFEEIQEAEKAEDPESKVQQLYNYINSTDLDAKDQFTDIVDTTRDLIMKLPHKGDNNRSVNEFLSSIERSVASFELHK